MIRTILASGERLDVNVQRKYRNVWVAAGDYRGRRVEVTKHSESEAVDAWLEAARGNSGPPRGESHAARTANALSEDPPPRR
jgi:hypothetical protein